MDGAYTVNLNSRPTDTVTVTIGGSDPAVSLSGDTLTNNQLTFTTTNWNTAQTIIVTPVKDDNGVGETITLTHTLSGGDYAGIAADSVTVNLTDSDTRNVVLSKQSLTVTEEDATGVRYTVNLASQPSDTVTVTISGHEGADLTLSGTRLTNNQLTFTTTNWDVAQTVTVEAGQDNDGANDTATLTHTASGGDYFNVTKDLPVSITDDDTADIVLSKTDLTLTEGDAAGTSYTVSLATQPSGTVIVTISGHDGTDLSLDKTSLTFTVDNWDVAQTVTVEAGQDNDGANDTATLTHTASGGDYASVSNTLPVTVTDDDPQVTVSFGQTAYTVPEGDTVTVTITLSADPERTVAIPLTTTDQGDASSADYSVPTSVTFDAGEVSKTITFTATDDSIDDDDESVLLAFGTLPSRVSAGTTAATTVSITDDDYPQVTVMFEVDAYTVAEGDTVTVTITLSADPERAVVIPLTATNQGSASSADYTVPTSVTFDADEMSKTITFTAATDTDNDDGESVLLAFGASLPTGVSEGEIAETTVSITDDDVPEVTVMFGADAYTVPEGDTVTVTITLSADPERTVEIPIMATNQGSASSADYTVPSSVTFNADEMSKTITFTAADDSIDDDDESVLLAFGASLPTGVSEGAIAETTVSITDDDVPQVTVMFGADAYTVPEGDTVTVTITLSADPERTVAIPLTATNQGSASSADYTVPSSVTFNADEMSKTITFTAATDTDNDDGESVLLAFGASLPTGVSEGAIAETTVSITDDDVPEVTVMFGQTAYTVAEGDTVTVTITLSADPERTVAIPLTATDQGDASSADYTVPSSVTFDADEMSQTITFTAADDSIDDDDESVLLAFGASLPTGVSEGAIAETTVSITDDDVPQVTVMFGADAYTVPEGDTVTVTITLSADPERTVAIPLTATDQGDASSADYTVPSSVTFDADEMSKTITFTAADDSIDDDDESVLLAFGASLPTGVSEGAIAETTVSITDDDVPQVTVMFGADAYTVPEGDTVTVTITLSADPERTVEIPITATDQGDASSADYTVPSSVTFDADEMSQTITFTAADDSIDDDGESVLLAFGTLPSRVSAGATNETTVSITDDDVPEVTVMFGQTAYTVAEGDTQSVRVTLSVDPERTVVIPLTATNQGSASAADYTVPSSVTFDADEMSKTITFTAADDSIDDDDESVLLAFGTLPSRVSAGTTAATTVSITDDDVPQVTVSFGQTAYTVPEGDTQSVTVTLSADPERTVIIPLVATNKGGATSADYSGVPASVTFNAGETSTSFTFMATPDDMDEDCECVLLAFGALPSEVSEGPTPTATVSIADIATTPEGTPTVPPAPTSLTAYGEDQSLYVRWEIPAGEDARASVTSYLVRYRQVGASSWRNVSRVNVGSSVREEDITGLTNRRAYEVQVAAVNRMGTGAWASVKGTPQAPYAVPPGPEGDEAFELGRLSIYWLDPDADQTNQTNVLQRESCTGSEGFRAFWTGPDGNRRADEWAVHINTRRGAGEVSYSFDESSGTPDGPYFSMNGTVNFEGDGALSLSVRGRFGSTWGTWWSPPVSLYCHEPEAPADTCSLQVQQQAVENTPAEGGPRIDGIPEVGQTLSADTTDIEDADGLENVVFQYQWLAENADIARATGATYTVVSGDVGKAIRVRIAFTDDGDNEETLTSAPTVVTVAGLQLQSATVDGATLTLTFNEVLDTGVTLGTTAFAVNVNGSDRSLIAVGVGESNVLLFLSSAVEAGDTVTVDYTVLDGFGFIRDIRGRKAASFSRQAVTNDTASAPLTARAHDAPSSHNGQDAFTFELRFSEAPTPGFSYTTVRDHAFTVTGGSVTYVRRLEPGKNVRWEIIVTPGSSADVAIDLNATTDCSAQGAICTEDGGKLSGGLLLVVPGPTTPATGAPTITGTARVGETLTADTTGISDGDGLDNATFAYQWLADNAEINGATASSYSLLAADEGKAITVRVSFTDDAGNDEELTSAATGAVAAAPPSPNTPATGAPDITGAAQVGEALTADTTGISDDDGLVNAAFAYQWLADDAEINGATASTYTLVAADEGKAIKVRVSFTDDAGNAEQLISAATGAVAAAPPPPNTPATGAPTITGAAQVGETLTADTTGISDDDGLDNGAFAHQWLAADAEINGATASTYTLVAADEGKAIKVRVTFTDDAGNDEELTSPATGAVAAAVAKPPLTASAHDVPSSHDGSATFTFELRFSEEFPLSYVTLRDHAFTVTGGSVTYVRRLEPGKNVRWEITVTPGSSADVAIALNATTDCSAQGAICTQDDRKLSGGLELTVNGA